MTLAPTLLDIAVTTFLGAQKRSKKPLAVNSLTPKEAFSVCRIQLQDKEIFDCRNQKRVVSPAILEWLGAVCPQRV